MGTSMIKVEIVYVSEQHQIFFETVRLERPQKAFEIIANSDLLERFNELKEQDLNIGTFSKKISLDTVISHDLRLEVYRALSLSPMERRRLLAKKRKK